MKKKNLAILLIIPFLVALFGIVTIQAAFNVIENDVVRINWTYRDNDMISLDEGIVELKATGVVADSRYPASAGNELVWTVENDDGAEQPHAEVYTYDNMTWYLKPLSVGWVVLTCTTKKGNVTPMRTRVYIYSGNAFVINTKVGGSAQNVDPTLYYGQYDVKDGVKQPAVIEFDVTVSDESMRSGITVDTERTSSNLEVDLVGETIRIKGAGEGLSTVALVNKEEGLTSEFSFEVVAGGVNVYTYSDLLYCTNESAEGEIVVLRKNFESRANYEASTATNVALFGTETGGGHNGFNFTNEVYRFSSTYNTEFIAQWNDYAATHSGYAPIDDVVIAGLRVQKDFYGNGYTLNLHNLCFPSQYSTVTDPSGGTYDYYTLAAGDLFRGPKPFYMLGDPNGAYPLVTAFGQDNVGLYIDGDNISLNDVKVKNCDFGLIVSNLNYAGTVVEVHGNGITVKNSVLSNGKNVMRSFSSKELTVDNCILSTSRNFLLEVGSNRYEKNDVNDTRKHSFTALDGSVYTATLSECLANTGTGDGIVNLFSTGFTSLDDVLNSNHSTFNKEAMRAALKSIQRGLNREDVIQEGIYDGSVEVNDTIFYRSGIAAIGVETMFNGPFLYNNSPSMVSAILQLFGSLFDEIVPMFPENISGASYPVSVNLSGNTRFFDYKSLGEWDISGLIDQNIGNVVSGLGLSTSLDITIDDIFPLKSILTNVASRNDLIYTAEKEDGALSYINIPVAFYGGGRNLSTVTTEGLTAGGLTGAYDVDLLDNYLDMQTSIDFVKLIDGGLGGIASDPNFMRYMKEVLTKTVTTVTGFESFKFRFGNDPAGVFDVENGTPLTPDYRDLIKA